MRHPDRSPIACAAAMMLCLFAAGWSVLLIAREPAFRRDMDWYRTLNTQIRTLERQAAELESLASPFIAQAGIADASRDIAGRFESAQIHKDSSESGPFRLSTITVTYSLVPFSDLAGPVKTAEAMRPPFKLVSCLLEAAPGKTGEGRVRLIFEHAAWR